MTLTEKQIKVNGVKLSYTEAGTGQPVLFIHGFPFNKSSWEAQMDDLEKDYRVIAFDQRGFGNSEAGDAEASIDLYASDLLQLIGELKLGKVIACGLSMGGYVLMNAVGREPEKFAGIILCDTQCIADSEEGRRKRTETIKKIESDGLQVFAENYVNNMFTRSTLEKKSPAVEHTKKMITSQKQSVVTGGLRALAARHETCNALKNVKVPAMIICGKEDPVTPVSQSELLNNALTGSRLKVIENASHLSNVEQPEAFNRALRDFLSSF